MIEADAFERGNIAFREWEASKKGGAPMSESKKMSKSKLKVAHKHAKDALKHGGFKQYGDRAKEVAYATMTKQEMDEVNYEDSGLEHPEKADIAHSKEHDLTPYEVKRGKAIERSMRKNMKESKEPQVADQKEIKVNEALKNSHNYSTTTRATPEASAVRDEFLYQELLKKFGIKK
jgi:hypothetical protein